MLLNCGVREDSLRVLWTSRRSNQSILKEVSSEHSLEGLRLKLKLQYFGCLMWRTDSFEKTLMLGKVEGRRRDDRGWDGWMALLSQWTWVCTSSGSWWWTGKPNPWGIHDFATNTEVFQHLPNWNTVSVDQPTVSSASRNQAEGGGRKAGVPLWAGFVFF